MDELPGEENIFEAQLLDRNSREEILFWNLSFEVRHNAVLGRRHGMADLL